MFGRVKLEALFSHATEDFESGQNCSRLDSGCEKQWSNVDHDHFFKGIKTGSLEFLSVKILGISFDRTKC